MTTERRAVPILTISALLFAILAAASSNHVRKIDHVIVVSVDGMKPESYTEPDTHHLKVPTLRAIVHSGAYSDGVQSVMPTVTYPNHTAMVTGVNPLKHGIYTNPAWDPYDRNYGGYRWYTEDIKVPTIYQIASQRGLKTALIHWPVTVGAQADFNMPEVWRASIPEDLKLFRALSTPGSFEAVAKDFPDFTEAVSPPDQTDIAWADAACYAIAHLKPNLMFVHLAMVDHQQHLHGPFSAEGNQAIETADAQIARIIEATKKAGTWNSTALVVVSDHGFAPISQLFRPGVMLREKGLVTLDAKGKITDWKATLITDGGSAYIYLKDPNDEATRSAVLAMFTLSTEGIRRIARHDDIVKMGGDPNALIALEAADDAVLASGYAGDAHSAIPPAGTHGYFPDRPEMRASMLFYSPPLAHGKIENAHIIDLAPTIARWLNLPLPNADGVPLAITPNK
jgi:predicted AlkP superfamily pyrophosphatase or phosphodiesterase